MKQTYTEKGEGRRRGTVDVSCFPYVGLRYFLKFYLFVIYYNNVF